MRSGRFSLRLFYLGAPLVLFCLQEILQESYYVAILSMGALRPRFHATSGFFLNRRIKLALKRSLLTQSSMWKDCDTVWCLEFVCFGFMKY